MSILIFPLLIAALYLLMLRPQQQRVRRQRALVSQLAVGDEVITAGGLIGRIAGLDDDKVWLDVGGAVTLTFLRVAISRRVDDPSVDDPPVDDPPVGDRPMDDTMLPPPLAGSGSGETATPPADGEPV